MVKPRDSLFRFSTRRMKLETTCRVNKNGAGSWGDVLSCGRGTPGIVVGGAQAAGVLEEVRGVHAAAVEEATLLASSALFLFVPNPLHHTIHPKHYRGILPNPLGLP